MEARWTEHPETLDAQDVRALSAEIDRAPYCAAYRLLRVIALDNIHSPQTTDELHRTAVYLPPSQQLLLQMSHGKQEWTELLSAAELQTKATDGDASDFALIDRFLDQMHIRGEAGTTSYDIGSIDVLQDISDSPVPTTDETSPANNATIATSADEQMAMIDDFIRAEESGTLFVPHTPQDSDAATSNNDNGGSIESIREKAFLTESLAKVYIKQHKYEQALAIIRRLNLKYQGKNTYFADQIRFLETIIEYSKNK